MEIQNLDLNQLVQDIQGELTRLNADTNYNAHSGLSVELTEEGISIFDDYARSILLDPVATLDRLKTLTPINWSEHDNDEHAFEDIWNSITKTGGI